MNKSSSQKIPNLQALLQEGLHHHQANRLDEAKQCYEKILAAQPQHADALHYLGTIYDQKDMPEKASELIEKSIQIKPGNPEAHNNLGLSYRHRGDLNAAASQFSKATDLDKSYTEAWYNLGQALIGLEKPDTALVCFETTLEQAPKFAQAYFAMGTCYRMLGKREEQIVCYHKSLEINPRQAQVWVDLGAAYALASDAEKAEGYYRKALEVDPKNVAGWYNLGNSLQEQGRIDEASACFDTAYENRGNDAILVKKIMMHAATPVHASADSIEPLRAKLREDMKALLAKGILVADPYLQVGSSNFYIAYHGLNNKELHEEIARFNYAICPDINKVAAHCENYKGPQGKIKIGILSSFFNFHTISKLYIGIIERLPRDRFEVTLIRVAGERDPFSDLIDQAADHVLTLPKNLWKSWHEIEKLKLDILFYTDIGMDAYTYILAFARMAPVQLVGWGHPDTTGLPTIDYFLSQEDLEPEGSEAAYSETLVRFKELPSFYNQTQMPPTFFGKEEMGIPLGKTLYVCPQTLFKFHPDFDHMMADILRKDPNGVILLIAGHRPNWDNLLKQRFEKHMPDVAERIIFLPRMKMDRFLSLLLHADALIDSLYFGGGNTTYEAFSLGLPIVTLPGDYMRGRVTYACYKKIGMMDLVAKDRHEYVELAYRLANDKSWQQAMRDKLNAQSHVLFHRQGAVDEMADFFELAVKKAVQS